MRARGGGGVAMRKTMLIIAASFALGWYASYAWNSCGIRASGGMIVLDCGGSNEAK